MASQGTSLQHCLYKTMVVTQQFIDHPLICPVGSTKQKDVIPSLLHSLLLVWALGHMDQLMCSMSPEKPLPALRMEVGSSSTDQCYPCYTLQYGVIVGADNSRRRRGPLESEEWTWALVWGLALLA